MSIAVKSGLPSLGSTEGAVITKDDISVTEETSPSASVGEDLPRGKSAYEVAVENGFSGTETEWLASLTGADGKSAYQIAVENGFTGTEAEWIESLKGKDGKTPYVGDNGNWFVGSDDTGKPSRGAKGDKGDTGATPNLTIGSVTTLEAGQNATASRGGTAESPVLNLGIPRGAKGEPGEGGAGAYYVQLDGDFPNYALSETTPLADIVAAYNDGKALFCRGYAGGYFTIELPLFSAFSSSSVFIFSGSHCVDNTGALPQNAMITITVEENGVYCEYNEYLTQSNIVTSVSASSTNYEVPSAKCLYDELQKCNLKQATANTLGGVKADSAEAVDTQPVRIGGDGKLYTAAGGTDISLGLTSAAVGQTIKVKAIDESGKPTAWEAADMSGDRWELINAIEIADGTEETNALTINTDKNGNTFSLKKARLITYFPKYTGESSIPGYSFTMINGFVSGPQAPLCYTSGLPSPNKSQNPEGWLEVDLSMPGYEVERVARFAGSGGRPAELMHWGARRLNGAETITSIGGTNMLIYPGCKFTLYGVRA